MLQWFYGDDFMWAYEQIGFIGNVWQALNLAEIAILAFWKTLMTEMDPTRKIRKSLNKTIIKF